MSSDKFEEKNFLIHKLPNNMTNIAHTHSLHLPMGYDLILPDSGPPNHVYYRNVCG